MDIRYSSHRKEYKNKETQVKCSFIADLYYGTLRKVKIKDIKIIYVNIGEIDNSHISEGKGTRFIYLTFNFDELNNSPLDEQFKILVQKLNEGLILLCERFSWDKTPFIEAFKSISKLGFETKIQLSKNKFSPKKTKFGYLQITKNHKESIISFVFSQSNECKFKSIDGLRLTPGDYSLNSLIGRNKGKWINEFEFEWVIKDKSFKINFNTNSYKTEAKPVMEYQKDISNYLNLAISLKKINQKDRAMILQERITLTEIKNLIRSKLY